VRIKQEENEAFDFGAGKALAGAGVHSHAEALFGMRLKRYIWNSVKLRLRE